MTTCIAETVKAESPTVDGKRVPSPPSITVTASFETVRSMVEASRPLRRPNRNKPRPQPSRFAELDALTSGKCAAWQDDKSQE